MLKHCGRFLVVGGVARNVMLTADEEMIILDVVRSEPDEERILLNKVHYEGLFPRPLLIGSSISCSGDALVIMGGGAVCFSFGTFWNRGCFALSLRIISSNEHSQSHKSQSLALETWKYLQTIELVPPGKSTNHVDRLSTLNEAKKFELVTIPRTKLSSADDFSAIVSLAKPVILEELDLGSCTKAWTSTYLKDHIGRDNKVRLYQKTILEKFADGVGCRSSSLSGTYGLRIQKFPICHEAFRRIYGSC
jgi:tRNA wybutosine-synthesizing protein 4